jgi:MoxR-like ATPase
VIVGQDAMLERLLVGLLAGGHVLLEGVPGLAKTLTLKTLAEVLGGSFARVQFTPDLVPSDLTGTRIYRPDTGGFDTELGPVFANFLLADEINRAPAKVQWHCSRSCRSARSRSAGSAILCRDHFW